ncbi:MAG: hypothetical protein WC489_05315 [Patescibacteria group bacterium]
MRKYSFFYTPLFLFLLLTSIIAIRNPVYGQHICGQLCTFGSCINPYECPGGVGARCGLAYYQCSGTTESQTCGPTKLFDSTPLCNTVGCNNPGTTDTASWGSYGACSVSCGTGTETRICNCTDVNNCTVACVSPDGACSATDSRSCCVSQAPQTKPTASCVQSGITRNAQVNWVFNDTGSTCGQAWGYNCAGNTNSFELRFSGGKSTETATSGLRTKTTDLFSNWGTYTVQVCALNGAGENCSTAVNCVLTAPTCTTSAATAFSCRSTNPPLAATYGNNADQILFMVEQNTSTMASPFHTDSGWTSSSPYTPNLATGTYYWNTYSRSTATPVVACVTPAAIPTGVQIQIDKTPPVAPVGSFGGYTPDPACLGKYFVSYSWPIAADTGCALLAAEPYQGQISLESDYSPVAHDTGWISTRTMSTQTEGISYAGGTTLYGQVRARDSLSNQSGWNTTQATIPLPTLYPTIHIQGTYVESFAADGSECVGSMSVNPTGLDIALNIVPNDGDATSNCTITESSYDCTVSIDNQGYPCANPNKNISISATYEGYTPVEWRAGNACDGAPVSSIPVNFSSNPPVSTARNTYFQFPTGAQSSWFKMNGGSFTSKTQRNNIIPNSAQIFDTTDDNITPPNNKYLIIQDAGAVLYQDPGTTLNLGANATEGFSANNYYGDNYEATSIFSPGKFMDYVKSRKQYKTITSTADIEADGIYYVEEALSIAAGDTALNNKKIVLLSDDGTITISGNIAPTGASLAIIADSIIIAPAVTEINAILIANSIDIGSLDNNADNKLKVNGNLIQLTPGFVNKRVLNSARSPSLFIKVNRSTYLDLLPYLSISIYDWRQIQ